MTTTEVNEAPEAATSGASEPTAQQETEKGRSMSTVNPHPVDSATRTCCGGIGRHTPECVELGDLFDAHGRPATGIPPVKDCPDWCTDPGHISESFRSDQNCYSPDAYTICSLEYVDVGGGHAAESMVGATAYRAFNHRPVVSLHVYGFGASAEHIDRSIKLTVEKARALASALDQAADAAVTR